MPLLYTKMKIFHFPEKLRSLCRDNDEVLPPLHIRIKPTNVCGHNCSYCAYRAANLQLGKDMVEKDHIPRGKMMEIIDDMADMGVSAVTFSGGGDPFWYPHLLETVRKLAQTRIKFASLTNGARLAGELAEVFSHQATWLRISIDGWDDKSYSSYRKVQEGEFTRVINNMERFRKIGGKCYLGACIVVDEKNAPHVYELARKLKDAGAHSVKVAPCIVSNEGTENSKYHRPLFSRVKEEIRRAVADLAGETFEVFDAYHQLEDKFGKEYTWCPNLQIMPVIGADLNVYACQDTAYNLEDGLLGSIEKQGFKDFWFSGKEKFFQIDPSAVCNHNCHANEKNKLILEYVGAAREHLGFV